MGARKRVPVADEAPRRGALPTFQPKDIAMSTNGFSFAKAKAVTANEDKGTTVELVDEAEEPMTWQNGDTIQPMTMTVTGNLGSRFREAERELQKRMLKQRKMEWREQSAFVTAYCVTAWEGFTDDTGKAVPCTLESVLEVFKAAPWLLNQMALAANDHTRFRG